MNRIISPYLYAGFHCNNNCIFCSESDEYLSSLKNKSLIDLKKDLREIRKKYDFVSIMGREPSIRPDIIEIIKYAKSLKFRQLGITSNGRMFSIPSFTKSILDEGVNQIGISLAGSIASVHDKQTQIKGSFTQTIVGIKNILKLKNKDTSLLVNLPMDRLNFKDLRAQLTLLTKLGVKEINILNVSPLSLRSRSKKIIVPMTTLAKHVYTTLIKEEFLNRKDLKILLIEFPPCCLPKEARKYFFPCLEKNNNKIRIPLCQDCPFSKNCDGILDSYISLFGDSEFRLD